MSRRVLVSRLEGLWNPLVVLELEPRDLAHLDEIEPVPGFQEGWRGRRYHQGRIRYFVDRLRAGDALEPIEIDNHCDNGRCYPQPVVTDGNHRLIAHILYGCEVIQVTYGGRLDVLAYLQGRRKSCPAE